MASLLKIAVEKTTLILMTKKILVTGFEPFDGDSINPSQEFIEWLETKDYSFELKTLVLPVSFAHAYNRLQAIIDEFNPTHVILTGLAKNRAEITFERIGINWVDARIPDNEGLVLSNQKILKNGVDGLFTTIDPVMLINVVKNYGAHAKVSCSAGEFVCNYLLYLYLVNNKNCPGIFIHLPGKTNDQTIFNSLEQCLQAL